MSRSKKLPLDAEANHATQSLLQGSSSYESPGNEVGVTLFRKKGVPTARVTLPAETS